MRDEIKANIDKEKDSNLNLCEDDGEEEKKPYLALYRQLFVVSGTILLSISYGMTVGFSATSLPQLQSKNSTIFVDEEMSSWIAGVVSLAMPAGCLSSTLVMDRYGRRRAQIFCAIPWIIGYILISTSTGISMLIFGRILAGFSTGFSTAVGSVYMAEVSEPKYRSFILSTLGFGVSLGILSAHAIGAVFGWRILALYSSAPPMVAVFLLAMSPESPAWLAQEFPDKAREAFYWLRADITNSSELETLLTKQSTREDDGQVVGILSFIKPFAIMLLLFGTQQFSGINAVIFYTVQIFQRVSCFDQYESTLAVDGMRLLASVAGCYLMKIYPKRKVFFSSAMGVICSLFALAIYLKWNDYQDGIHGNEGTAWLPIIFLNLYVFFVTYGMAPIPWMLLGEIYPRKIRSAASGLTSCVALLLMFAVVKTVPLFIALFGTAYAFATYAYLTTVGVVILFFCMPETSNIPLQQVEDNLTKKTDACSIQDQV